MNEKQLTNYLEHIAAKEIPDDMNKWPEIHAQLAQRRTRSRPMLRALSGIAAALVIVLTGLIGYAFSQGPSSDPGLDHVDQLGLLQPLNLTESHDGVTITLTEGYADVNRIALWMTIESDQLDTYLRALRPMLSYANGDFLNSGISPIPIGEPDANVQQFAISFDLAEPLPNNDPLDLKLELVIGGMPIPVIPDDITLEPGPIPDDYMLDIPELPPFEFIFQLDVQESLVLTPQQTVEVNGVAITLDQITLAPSQIKLRLCFDLPDGGDWQPQVEVRVDGVKGLLQGYGLTRRPDPAQTQRCTDFDIAIGVTPESSQVEVLVDRLQTSASYLPENQARAQERLAAQGIELEFDLGEGHFGWEIIRAPKGMDEAEIGMAVWDALSEQYPGPWSFTMDLPADD